MNKKVWIPVVIFFVIASIVVAIVVPVVVVPKKNDGGGASTESGATAVKIDSTSPPSAPPPASSDAPSSVQLAAPPSPPASATEPVAAPPAPAPSAPEVTSPPPLAPVQAPVVASGTQAAEAAAPKPTTATVLPVPKPAKPLPPVVPWKECDGTPYSSTPVLSSFAMTAGEDVTLDEFKQRKVQLQCAMAVVDKKCDRGKYAGMLVGGIHYDGKATVAHGSDGSITVLAPKTLKEPVKVWTKHTANFGSLKCIDDARRYLEELKKQGTISSFEISPEMTTTSGVITVKFRYAFVTTSKAVKDEQLKCYIFKTSSAKVTK
eukprot:jgi/Mesvir1/3063/Mv16469-RA.1